MFKTNMSRKCNKCGLYFFIEENLKYNLDLFARNECFKFLVKRNYSDNFSIKKIGEEYYRILYSEMNKERTVNRIKCILSEKLKNKWKKGNVVFL